MVTQNKRLIGIVLSVAFILLIPFIGMQLTDEVSWTLFDFVVAGILLLGTGLLCELVMRTVKNVDFQIGILAVILISLFLLWAEIAVGIFGTPFAGN
ncbi:hypothetical protein ACFS7Z_24750 [Pontibacter toksunensis]|uniref:Uncharacterized protein n=1 Tax=Pontibacter toksunensis TaxID=1332631 RepID=A0ABW6C1D8_9BACT